MNKISPTLRTDAELATAARSGDKRAFVEIVTRHQAMVCGIALGILGDFASSEDAGQEAFLTAWSRIQELKDPDRLRGWLGQIARNCALAHRRRRRTHQPLEDDVPVADDARSPDEAAACEEEAALVREALRRLPELYRLPLILYYREGQSVRQAAEALGLGEDALKQRLVRGREMLREQMAARIETALSRTAPTALFTVAVATAIGALAPPTAVAGSAFAAGSASASAPTSSVAANLLHPLLHAMSASKIATGLAACLVAAVCVPIGYGIHPRSVPSRLDPRAGDSQAWPAPPDLGAVPVTSAFLAEWQALHTRYGTNAAAMPQIFQAISELTDPVRRRAFRAALISEWVEVDAIHGFSFLLDSARSAGLRRQFFREWLAKDAAAAVGGLLQAGAKAHGLARESLLEIARLAPDRVPEITTQLPAPEGYWERQVQEAFVRLAERDLAGARRAAETLPPANRAQALEGVAQAWGKSAFAEAIAWARGLPDGTDRDEIIRAALVGRASVDPVGALESVGMVPAGGRYAHFATTTGARVLSVAAQTDFELTARWLTSHPGQFSREDLEGLAGVVTQRLNADPATFLTARADDGSLTAMLPAISSALLNGSGGQRSAVWDWLRAQPSNPATEQVRTEVLDAAAFQDPSLAIRLATELPTGSAGDRLMARLASCLLNGGESIARYQVLHDQAPDRLRRALVEAAFIDGLRGDTLEDPGPWISRLPEVPEASRDRAAASLSRAWAQQDPEAALAWASSIPSETGQLEAVAAAVGAWAGLDLPGAAAWLTSLPAGARRDRGTEALAVAIASTDPQQAWAWALSIQDPRVRVRAAGGTLDRLARRDSATAQRWIESSPFTVAERQQLHGAVREAAQRRR